MVCGVSQIHGVPSFYRCSNLAERILPATKLDVNELQPGEGKVGSVDGKFMAVCRGKSGNLHMHNPRCIHMEESFTRMLRGKVGIAPFMVEDMWHVGPGSVAPLRQIL